MKTSRWDKPKPIVVFGVISQTYGIIHWMLGEHSFNAQNICQAMREVWAKFVEGSKLAMSMDNAPIYRALDV